MHLRVKLEVHLRVTRSLICTSSINNISFFPFLVFRGSELHPFLRPTSWQHVRRLNRDFVLHKLPMNNGANHVVEELYFG